MAKIRKKKETKHSLLDDQSCDFRFKMNSLKNHQSVYRYNLLELRDVINNRLDLDPKKLNLFKDFERNGGSPVKLLL